ncbi:hypothetical protein D3C80_2211970 [compost metagenome]
MLVTVLAAWLIGSQQETRRNLGFWVFLASNALWIAWGLHAQAWALILLQVCLAAMNIRGAKKTADSV